MPTMLDFTKKVFFRPNDNLVPQDAKIIFVSDLYANEYEGGAELSTQTIIDTCKEKFFTIKSSELTSEVINLNKDKIWIFGNFSNIKLDLISLIIQKINYYVIEYDYKYCKYRSSEKHSTLENKKCDCATSAYGQLIAAFFTNAKHVFWMSELQRNKYYTLFESVKSSSKNHSVLSSMFSKKHLHKIVELSKKYENNKNDNWIILGSNSWIKGYEDALKFATEQKLSYKTIWNLPYEEALEELAKSKGFIYIPRGADTCPRMIIEAKLLNCKLYHNNNVQNLSEPIFSSKNLLQYLESASDRFWNVVYNKSLKTPTISGYTQTRNCIEQNYPWEESINSLLGFCDEVVVVDGGSTDGTWERLLELSNKNSKIKAILNPRNWDDKRFALYNGQQKAVARTHCTGDFLWQVDIDEVVHEKDYEKIKKMILELPNNVDLVALPVVEYWGGEEKVRVDVNPWKWRLSRNNPKITHGVPKQQRLFDENGEMYSAGSDGDDYIYSDTLEPVPFVTFYNNEVDSMRNLSLRGNVDALKAYEMWLNKTVEMIPGVYHYSWYNLERKIHTYKNFWSKHWLSLYNKKQEDTAENNMFFNKAWSDVTDEEIKELAINMKNKLGGWIFHKKINFNTPTPHVKMNNSQPSNMKNWVK